MHGWFILWHTWLHTLQSFSLYNIYACIFLAGVDYDSINASVIFIPGSDVQCLGIAINDDNNIEGDEQFTLIAIIVTELPGLSFLNTSTVTIIDNDGKWADDCINRQSRVA